METPQWRGSYTGGIWQDVFLSYTGQTHINDVFITGNFRNGDIEIINEINNGIGDGLYKLIFDINKKQSFEELFTLENTNLKVIKKIKNTVKNHQIWSPENPNLYEFEIKLQKVNISNKDTIITELDRIKETFGFREFTVKNNKFYLNDKPLYLKAAFFEGLYLSLIHI